MIMSDKGILLHTDFTGEEVKFDVKDGKTVINDKEFIVDRIKPINLKSKRLGREKITPFYILKWSKIEPANIQLVEREEDGHKYAEVVSANILQTLEVTFPENGEDTVLPEMLRETHDMRYMKHLKKYAGEGAGGGKKLEFKRWMLFPIVLVLSGIVMFFINGGKFF
jgi:excinuclease UvrABC nuclease subunit